MVNFADKRDSVTSLNEIYRNHELSTHESSGTCVGQVCKDGQPIAYCEASEIHQSLQHLRSIVDEHLQEQYRAREHEPPSPEELQQAIAAIRPLLTPSQMAMLRIQTQQKDGAASLDALKSAGGCHSTTDVYFGYANIARILCDELAYMPPLDNAGRDPALALLLTESPHPTPGEPTIVLTLQPDILQALISLDW